MNKLLATETNNKTNRKKRGHEMEYQIRLTLENGNYIILEDKKTLESVNYMMNWYNRHKEFYNGNFEIVEKEIQLW